MKRWGRFYLLDVTVFCTCLVILTTSCGTENEEGALLSHKYCASCHEYPDPALLQRDIWTDHVLPEMGLRLGIGDKNTVLSRMSFKQFDHLVQLGIYPDKQVLSLKDWKAIVAYYEEHSPSIIPAQAAKSKVLSGGGLFVLKSIPSEEKETGQTTMVKFVPSRKEFWMGNRQNTIRIFGNDGRMKQKFRTPSPVVDVLAMKESVFLSIGNMLPNEDKNGRLYSMDEKGDNPKLLLDSLHRPVQFIKYDLDQDGIDDWVILEFGWETGQIRMVNGKSSRTSILSSQPGARNMLLRDMDQDGLKDLVVLFSQAREQISYFHNKGGGQFQEKVLLKFPSVYGSSYLEMADMNGDGMDDLIVSNGDNADYSLSLKAFHGIRIYLKDQKGNYSEKWFFPSFGATKALARDFDNDGDADIAMIAFFSDKSQQGSFIYFENQGGMQFKPWDMNVPEAHWLVMESQDMDDDGDQDILLGNFQFGSDQPQKASHNIQALLLENKNVLINARRSSSIGTGSR